MRCHFQGTKAQLHRRLITCDELNAEDMRGVNCEHLDTQWEDRLLVLDHVDRFMDLPPKICNMVQTRCDNPVDDPAGIEWGLSWNKYNHGMVYQASSATLGS